MRTIGNILWFVLAGWWLALYYALCGLIAFVLIVTIPFGIAAFKLSVIALVPLGTRVVDSDVPPTWSAPMPQTPAARPSPRP